jgi:hypothetical protein
MAGWWGAGGGDAITHPPFWLLAKLTLRKLPPDVSLNLEPKKMERQSKKSKKLPIAYRIFPARQST